MENKTCAVGPFYEVLTAEELASRWRVPESWVREQTRSRCLDPIPHIRLGRYVDSVGTVRNSRLGGNDDNRVIGMRLDYGTALS